jgi:hypothetical protein
MKLACRRECWLLLFISCGLVIGSCARHAPGNSNDAAYPASSSEAVFMQQPISYCWQRPLQPKRGRVQILIDSSGSMVGFQQTIPPLVNWVKHSISQLQQTTLAVENSRFCQFSQGNGIYNCTNFSQAPIAYRAFGDTNLHDAIRSAKDYALTFIITDGVAATGSRGLGDCAAGVDAACVARALREVMHAQSPEGEDIDRGLWIVPLLATYDGTFFTEEPILPSNFQLADTIQQIRADIGVQAQAVVQDPRTGYDGRLIFGYRGPRSMLLIVIARWADVGRAAVQALWERTDYLGVQRIEQMKGFSSGLASFSPIEVYPGFVNSVRWTKMQEPADTSQTRGTMDAYLETDTTAKSSISMTCPKNGSGEGVYSLSGTTTTADQRSGCVAIRLLPAFSFRFRTVNPEDDSEVPQFLKGYELQGTSYTDLKLHLACTMTKLRPCGEKPISVQWMAYMSYKKAADGLASPEGGHPVQQQIIDISTAHPSREPHRIFAFSKTLEAFYREVEQDQRSIVLGSIDICHKK